MTTIVISSIIVIAIILIALTIRLENQEKASANKDYTGEALVEYAETIKKIENSVAELVKEQEEAPKEITPKKKKSRPRKKSAPKKKED